jgi:hypothetical protein
LYEIESLDGKTKRDILYRPDGSVNEIEQANPVGPQPSPGTTDDQGKKQEH